MKGCLHLLHRVKLWFGTVIGFTILGRGIVLVEAFGDYKLIDTRREMLLIDTCRTINLIMTFNSYYNQRLQLLKLVIAN